jgi:hypothetical protein
MHLQSGKFIVRRRVVEKVTVVTESSHTTDCNSRLLTKCCRYATGTSCLPASAFYRQLTTSAFYRTCRVTLSG